MITYNLHKLHPGITPYQPKEALKIFVGELEKEGYTVRDSGHYAHVAYLFLANREEEMIFELKYL